MRCRGVLLVRRRGSKFAESIFVSRESDGIPIFLSLACVSIDSGAATLEVGHESTLWWAVSACSSSYRDIRFGGGDVITAAV